MLLRHRGQMPLVTSNLPFVTTVMVLSDTLQRRSACARRATSTATSRRGAVRRLRLGRQWEVAALTWSISQAALLLRSETPLPRCPAQRVAVVPRHLPVTAVMAADERLRAGTMTTAAYADGAALTQKPRRSQVEFLRELVPLAAVMRPRATPCLHRNFT